jgi:hypothetical protein
MGLRPGIHITGIQQPESGGILATYCPICKRTEIFIHEWATKPDMGDFFYMPKTCVDYIEHDLMIWQRETPCRLTYEL